MTCMIMYEDCICLSPSFWHSCCETPRMFRDCDEKALWGSRNQQVLNTIINPSGSLWLVVCMALLVHNDSCYGQPEWASLKVKLKKKAEIGSNYLENQGALGSFTLMESWYWPFIEVDPLPHKLPTNQALIHRANNKGYCYGSKLAIKKIVFF